MNLAALLFLLAQIPTAASEPPPRGPPGVHPPGLAAPLFPFGPFPLGGPRMRGGPGRGELAPVRPGEKLATTDVPAASGDLYDTGVLRTLFLQFDGIEADGWEQALEAAHQTGADVPATLTVDGRRYPGVGVRFRGMSSFMMVPAGHKRSLNISVDAGEQDQRLGGYRTLNLLNANGDPSFLRTVLYQQIARRMNAPIPKANFVRLVINGESWGVYVNVQQFNKDLTEQLFGSRGGARWKVPGSPHGDAGLNDLGDDLAEYRRRYEIKSADDPQAWAALVELTRVLERTPPARLESALRPLLDVDGALKFLALENALINSDGYWTRASDYNLYRDPGGRFHLIPHDFNEAFQAPEGPGQGPGGSGVDLDPLAGADNPRRPLLARLLAVPALRARYVGYLRQIAAEMDWTRLQPVIEGYRTLIAGAVARDTRKLYTTEAFEQAIATDVQEAGRRGPHVRLSLKSFLAQRRAFLLAHPLLDQRPLALPAPQGPTRPDGGAADLDPEAPIDLGGAPGLPRPVAAERRRSIGASLPSPIRGRASP